MLPDWSTTLDNFPLNLYFYKIIGIIIIYFVIMQNLQ